MNNQFPHTRRRDFPRPTPRETDRGNSQSLADKRTHKFILDNLGCLILAAMAACVSCFFGAFLQSFLGG